MLIAKNTRKDRLTRAFTLKELLAVVFCLTVLFGLWLPGYLKKLKARSSPVSCANQLMQIGLAFRTFAVDNDGHFPMEVSATNGGTLQLTASGQAYVHFAVLSNELNAPKVLLCPEDTKRRYATNFSVEITDNNLSYFINVDAKGGNGSSLLSGDRNITNSPVAGTRTVQLVGGTAIGWNREVHKYEGHTLLGDGSVNRCTNLTVQLPDGVTNRLVVP